MAAALVLTVDELRALRRVVAVTLPRFVTAADTGEVRVDAAAVRGLAVRRLVELPGGGALDRIRIGTELTRLLTPASRAHLLAEVEMETVEPGLGARVGRRAVVAGPGHAVLLTELPAGLVSIEAVAADAERVLAGLCRLDEVADAEQPTRSGGTGAAPAAGTGFTVDAQAQADADALVLEGADATAVAVLVAAGVAEPLARAWTAAVAGRRRAVGVSVARDLAGGSPSDSGTGAGPFEAGELRWLVADDGTAWKVEPACPDQARDPSRGPDRDQGLGYDLEQQPDAAPAPLDAVITRTDQNALRRELAALLGHMSRLEVAAR